MGDNKDTRADFALVESTIMKWDYSVLLSLADRRYAGVALLVKRCLQPHVKAVRFNLPGASETHHPEGRFILIEFERSVQGQGGLVKPSLVVDSLRSLGYTPV